MSRKSPKEVTPSRRQFIADVHPAVGGSERPAGVQAECLDINRTDLRVCTFEPSFV